MIDPERIPPDPLPQGPPDPDPAPGTDTPIDVSPELEQPDAHTPLAERPLASNVAGIARVRGAGPEAIARIAPRPDGRWDETDQAVDESFPASDPPGQGVG